MIAHLKSFEYFKLKEKLNIIAFIITFIMIITTIMTVKNYYTAFYGTNQGYTVAQQDNNTPNQDQGTADIGELNKDESINTLAQASSTIYFDPSNGADTNDGLTSDKAVKTFDKAKALSSSNGTIYLCNTLTLSTANVTIDGEDKNLTLKRYESDFTGAMIDVTATGINIKNLTIDGGAVWTGDLDETLGRGTTNSGIQAKRSIIIDDGMIGVTIQNCTLQNNDNQATGTSVSNGGAFYGKIIGYDLKILNNSTYNVGGGIYTNSGSSITRATFEGNYSKSSGGALFTRGVNLYAVKIGTEKSGNEAGSSAGGVALNGSKLTAQADELGTPTTIENNKSGLNGGGFCSYNNGETFEMEGGYIRNNSAVGNGGGINASGFVTLTGVKVGPGNSASNGGGIYVSRAFNLTSSQLTMQKLGNEASEVKGNTAVNSGGGMYIGNTRATIDESIVGENSAGKYGAGLYVKGTSSIPGFATLTNVEVSQNGTGASTPTYGGGIFIDPYGTFTMTGGNISSNASTTYGGGIMTNGTTTLKGVIVGGQDAGNTTTGSTSYGGGIYVNGGTVTVTDETSISYNKTRNGGGVYVSSGTFTMTGGNISSNTGSTNGGGIYTKATTELHGVIIGGKDAGNTTNSYGGGIHVAGGVTTVTDDTVISYNKAPVGGVYVYSTGTFTMAGGSVSLNTNGGVCSYGKTTLKGVTVGGKDAGNTGPSYGGGVSVYGGTTTVIDDTNITYNSASERGGGVYVYKGTFTMTGGSISSNSSNRNGGGVYVFGGSTFTMTGGNISSNTSTAGGGGICTAGTTELHGVTIGGPNAGNETTKKDNIMSNSGGGIRVEAGTTTISDSTNISYNSSGTAGGVYVLKDGTFTMTGGSVSSNAADFGGGGVYSSGTTTLKGVTVGGSNTGNTASSGYGGGILVSNGTCELISDDDGNLTNILNNSSESAGGVSVASGSTLKMTGGNISSNTSTKNGGGIYTNGTTELNGVIVGGKNAGNTTTSTGGYGGGVYVDASGTFTMTGGNISANIATSYGGGIYSKGTTELHGVTVGGQDAGNTTTSTGGYGGGICVYSGTTTVTDGTSITYNTCGYGGGVRVEKDGTFIMTGGNISSNTSKYSGAGICTRGTIELHGVTVGGQNAGNTTTYSSGGNGGGIRVVAGTTTVTDDTNISYNTDTGNGAGVSVNTGATFIMTGGNISSNTSSKNGGGIYSTGTIELHGVTIGGQNAGNTSAAGGGIYVYSGITTVADETSISYNMSSDVTNIYLYGGTLNMNGVQVLTSDTSKSSVKLNNGTVNWSNMVKIDEQVEVSANTVNSIVTGALTDDSHIKFNVAESVVNSSWTVVKSNGSYAMTEADADKFSVQSNATYRIVKFNLGTTTAEVKIALPIKYTITIPESISGENEIMNGNFDVNLSYTNMLSNEKIKMDIIVPQEGIIMKRKIGSIYDNTKYLKAGFGLSTDNIIEYSTSGTYEVLRLTRQEYDQKIFNKKVYWQIYTPSGNAVVDLGDYEVPDGVTFNFSIVS